MQVRFFNIPIRENEQSADDLNGFLRGHRVLELREQFVNDGSNSCWCLMVKYLEGTTNSKPGKRGGEKVDYKNVLDEASFGRFCALRKARKQVAEEEGLPAFAIFTDKQMAELARAERFSAESMSKVDGIGSGKAEKYGPLLESALHPDKQEKEATDETGGQSV